VQRRAQPARAHLHRLESGQHRSAEREQVELVSSERSASFPRNLISGQKRLRVHGGTGKAQVCWRRTGTSACIG
jgi:hypothetical protein